MRGSNTNTLVRRGASDPVGSKPVRIKRAYEAPERKDGYRVLIDRLWPRGVVKSELALDVWEKRLAPSDELRRWFGHDPLRWSEFKARYKTELHAPDASVALNELAKQAMARTVTLVYGARDEEHNHAIVLRIEVERRVRTAMLARSRTRKTD